MKVLIWLACILVYSAAVSALNLAGVGLGGVPVVLLAILLIFLPAPALCRLLDRRRQQRQDAAADPPAPAPAPAQDRRPFPVEKVLISLVVLFVIVACSLQSYHAGVEKGMLSAEALRDEISEDGYRISTHAPLAGRDSKSVQITMHIFAITDKFQMLLHRMPPVRAFCSFLMQENHADFGCEPPK